MNAAEAEAAIKALEYPTGGDKAERAERMNEYRQARTEIELQFKQWLADEYAYEESPKIQDRVWGKAWEHGHSSGYFDVENYYIDYAEFAQAVIYLANTGQ